ncbi:3-dehydroquinate synthase [Rickettsiales bacterium]|nr:3-dehydroquinate synthase [Rickettsiales bacterium]
MSNINKQLVDLGDRSYEILVGENLLSDAASYIEPLLQAPRVFIVTDENVAPLYLKTLVDSLESKKIKVDSFILPAGESTKSMENLENLLDDILKFKPERKVTFIALGGGVIGDLTGFAASILLRGVNFIQIPTTLLSQVDSSVGGKTGVNSKFGKNLIGSFYQPNLVLIDVSTLKTLHERQYWAGYAEVLKYGLIRDKEFFQYLDDNIEAIKNHDSDILKNIISKSCAAKAKIVSEDERESGVRALLNLGHTFGHALEAETGFGDELVHGEAVAIGMILAFLMSVKLGICSQGELDLVVEHYKKTPLLKSMLDVRSDWDEKILLDNMYQDKKVSGGKLVFILVNSIGDALIKKDVEPKVVLDTLKSAISS